MVIADRQFEKLVAGVGDPQFLQSKPVSDELEKLAAKFEVIGKAAFCESIWSLYGPNGSKLQGLISR
ncbi:MAG: hypothetical protein R3D67_00055 [Hyphomicrobiaceae bacterium]